MIRLQSGANQTEEAPQFILIAGANGSGKSTSAPLVLPYPMPYLNADETAKELARTHKGNMDLLAGRMLLETWDRFVRQRVSFAAETTLASKSLVPRIRGMQVVGYEFHLFFFWLPDVELSIARVAERVRMGGHDIPEPTIRRRYRAGLSNLSHLYIPLADTWRVYDNSQVGHPIRVAFGRKGGIIQVDCLEKWEQLQEGGEHGPAEPEKRDRPPVER